jgi:hypothetical protein
MALRGYHHRSPVLASGEPARPEAFIDAPGRQFTLLGEKYRHRALGRIPLPRSLQHLWVHHIGCRWRWSAHEHPRSRNQGRYAAVGKPISRSSVCPRIGIGNATVCLSGSAGEGACSAFRRGTAGATGRWVRCGAWGPDADDRRRHSLEGPRASGRPGPTGRHAAGGDSRRRCGTPRGRGLLRAGQVIRSDDLPSETSANVVAGGTPAGWVGARPRRAHPREDRSHHRGHRPYDHPRRSCYPAPCQLPGRCA